MKNQKMYEADDKMISLIRDNYDLLQSLGSFGISLGFGDKTVQETCEDNDVDTYTFLAVVNYTINGTGEFEADEQISVPTLLHYLEASHAYFLDFQLPFIRRELAESLNEDDSLARLILRFYDEYAHEIRRHMQYEQKTLFPYVNTLLEGQPANDYNVETFSKHHGAADKKLRELKLLIIKYLPQDGLQTTNSPPPSTTSTTMRSGCVSTRRWRITSSYPPSVVWSRLPSSRMLRVISQEWSSRVG